jgi:hypothetical protein
MGAGSAPLLLGFLAFCGIALLLSIPLPLRLSSYQVVTAPLQLPLLYYAFPVASGLLGLSLGAWSVARAETGWMIARLAGRIALAHTLSIPLLIYAHALAPDEGATLVLTFVIAVLVGTGWAIWSRRMERTAWASPGARRAARYGAFLLSLALPLPIAAGLSPLTVAASLADRVTAGRIAVAFALPLLVFALGAVSLRRGRKGGTVV